MASKKIKINSLNDDCLVNIFDFLPFIEKFKIERVCKKWHRLSELSWRNVRRLQIDNKEFPNSNLAINVIKKCGQYLNFVQVNFYYVNFNYAEIFKELLDNCQNINKFIFYDSEIQNENKPYSEYDIGLLFKKNTKIQSISLSFLTLDGYCFLTLKSDLITEFVIKGCKFKSKHYLNFISELKNLKRFFLIMYDENNKKEQNKIIQALNNSNCESLYEFIILDQINEGGVDALKSLLSRQKNLTHLYLMFTKQEIFLECVDEKMPRYLNCFENLISLQFKVHDLTNSCVKNLSLKCLNLKNIYITPLKKYSLTMNGEKCFSRFQKLEIFQFTNYLNEQVDINNILKALSQCKNLKTLDLSDCKFTDMTLINICSFSNLTSLSLNHCEITESELIFIVKNLLKLTKLTIGVCKNLTSYYMFEIISDLKTARQDEYILVICISYSSLFKNIFLIKSNKLPLLKIL